MLHDLKLLSLFTGSTTRFFYTCCRGIVILTLMSMAITGCAPAKFPPFKADEFNTYKNQVTKSDLHMAVWPMMDKEQQKKFFGVELNDVGVLAVFIIARNQSPTERFLLRDDLITLQHQTTKQFFPKAQQTDAVDDAQHEGARQASQIVTATSLLLLPVVSFGSIATSLSLAQNSVGAKAIQDNLFEKTLYTQTILPDKTAEGFAFFKLTDNKIILNDLLLRVQATNEKTEVTDSFEFTLPSEDKTTKKPIR